MSKYYQVKRNKYKNAVGLFDKGRNYNKSAENLTKQEKLMKGVAKWASVYRARPDFFVEDYLGISLKPFQKVLLYVMMHYHYTAIFASRGLGKTWLTALFCVVMCILYPGTKIVIAAGQKSQAMKIVTEKIPELITKSKTGMLAREIKGSIRTSMNTDDPNVEFLNGSWIKVVASNEGARSARANVLILDEFRFIDPKIYRNVLRRFLAASRQPRYLEKEKYKNNPKYLERNKEIFLTSCNYKFNWSYERFKVFKKAMLEGKKYFVCGFPYQIAVKENLVNKEQLIDELSEEDIDIIGWTMEMDSLFFGESEKAYFKTEELQSIKTLQFPIYKKELHHLIKNKNIINKPKKEGEIRILSCDIALMGGDENDSSIFTLLSAKPSKNGTKYYREVLNMESFHGLHPETQALTIRRLFDDFVCDYIVLDRQGNGISVYSYLCRRLFDHERKIEYIPFYSMNEKDDPKLASYHIEDEYEERIFTVSATEELNNDIAIDLKNKIIEKRIRLLISPNEIQEFLNGEKWFHELSPEDQIQLLNPYLQTVLLENEMVLLERQEHPKYVKLQEQRGKRKDRYTSVAYGNYFISLLEKDLVKNNHEVDLFKIPTHVSTLNISL